MRRPCRRGAEVRVVPWNAGDSVDRLAALDLAVLRAPWDYPHDMPGFTAWLDSLERLGVPLLNPPGLVRWNLDKRYLLDLARKDVPIPATALLQPGGGPAQWHAALASVGRAPEFRAVLKPCWGGSGLAVQMTSAATIEADVPRAQAEAPGRPWMVQAFMPEVTTEGETSFVFVAGHFAHAVRTRPAAGEFRVNARYAPPPPRRFEPPGDLLGQARRVLDAMPGDAPPLYARIDGLNDGAGRFVCLEAEAIDPTLFLQLAPDTAGVLADATLSALMRGRARR